MNDQKKDVFNICDGLPAYAGRWSDAGNFAKLYREAGIYNIFGDTKKSLSSTLVTSLFALFATFYHRQFLFQIPVEF